MKIYNFLSTDPRVNLASEYFLLSCKELASSDVFILWQNKHTIVIGKNQSLNSEVNVLLANKDKVNIVRRFSGGGAVYQDMGNVCFTIIRRNQRKTFDFLNALSPIIDFLQQQGIKAQFHGRNDILLDGKKISGNAVYFYKNDYLIHGTLLFDVDVEKMMTYLSVDKSKLSSKGIDSIRKRVANIADYVDFSCKEFSQRLLKFFEDKYLRKAVDIDLTNNEEVIKWKESTFGNDNWIYDRDFEFNYENSLKLDSGILKVKLATKNNVIKDLEFYTDALMQMNDLRKMAKKFNNKKYVPDEIKKVLKTFDLEELLPGLDESSFLNLMFNNLSNTPAE